MSTRDSTLDADCIARIRAGDAVAAAEFDARHRGPLVRFCQGYLGRREDAEDIAAEVFVELLATRQALRRPGAWLLRVARNRCLNLLRSRGRTVEPIEERLELAASLTGASTRMMRAEERAELARALGRLSSEQRELVRLRYGEDLSREELAELFELPVSVVKSRLHEALELLRTAVPPP